MAEYNCRDKIVIIGAGAVGKSSLMIRLFRDNFVDEYDPTIEGCYQKICVFDKEVCLLDIWDTAIQEEYPGMRDSYILASEGFLCAYSITSRASFDEIVAFREQILRVKDEDSVPMVLVGTKSDLECDRQVSIDEGQELAHNFGCPIFEASAKTGINVEDAFYEVVREIHKARNKTPGVSDNTKNSVTHK